jgi:hypothetical protein
MPSCPRCAAQARRQLRLLDDQVQLKLVVG